MSGEPTPWRKALGDAFRKETTGGLAKYVLPGGAMFGLLQRTESLPWWLAMAPVLVAILAGIWLRRRGKATGSLALKGPLWLIVILWALGVMATAGPDLLTKDQTPMLGVQANTASNFLGMIRFGNWRYILAPRPRPVPDLIVVTLPDQHSIEDRRSDLRLLIASARKHGARGLALDFRFLTPTAVDDAICRQVRDSLSAPMPIIVGQDFQMLADGDLARVPLPETLGACFPVDSSQGHIVVHGDPDGRVRALPLGLRGDPTRPALSVRIARLLARPDREVRMPRSPVLMPIPPEPKIPRIAFAALQRDTLALERLRDRIVVVGEDSGRETFDTPWGDVLGVELHAQAANALVTGRYFRTFARWPALIALLVAGYLIAYLVSEGTQPRTVLGASLALTTIWVAIAGIAALQAVWIDLVHVLFGFWVLVLGLLFWRQVVESPRGPDPGPAPGAP